MATAEELRQLIQETVRVVIAGMQGSGQQATGGDGSPTKRTLEPKGVSRVDGFCGKEGQWREWSFQLRVAVKAMGTVAGEIMGKVEQSDTARDLNALELEFPNKDVTRIAGIL